MSEFENQNDLPDFEKNQKNSALKKALILSVLAILILLIGYAFGYDLQSFTKILRLL